MLLADLSNPESRNTAYSTAGILCGFSYIFHSTNSENFMLVQPKNVGINGTKLQMDGRFPLYPIEVHNGAELYITYMRCNLKSSEFHTSKGLAYWIALRTVSRWMDALPGFNSSLLVGL